MAESLSRLATLNRSATASAAVSLQSTNQLRPPPTSSATAFPAIPAYLRLPAALPLWMLLCLPPSCRPLSSFGGRLGLIVPAGAPPPLANPNTTTQWTHSADSSAAAAHSAASLAAHSTAVPLAGRSASTCRASLAPLSDTEAERKERLRAMQHPTRSRSSPVEGSRRERQPPRQQELSSRRSTTSA